MAITRIYVADLVFKELMKIAVPKSIDLTKRSLILFAASINKSDVDNRALPGAALIGLGRCGTNVCLEVARQLEAVIPSPETESTSQDKTILARIRAFASRGDANKINPYLFEPVILLADVDHRMAQADALGLNPGGDGSRRPAMNCASFRLSS
ncbi:hypothetical protein [Paraburkholderia sp. RAU2J]|uniref:hypothetical protein n=1 Tax=Paraburkholderia sp. RAU2J TaxID=1938810 RepID=UPI0011C41FC2|nr:hypothetical protein [Paraburkholderia sp. RAU2J]